MLKFLTFFLSLLSSPLTLAGQFYFQLENDVTFGEDGNYSNGLIVGWESKPVQGEKVDSLVGQWQNKLFFSQSNPDKAWGLKVSQRMWTPDEIKIMDAQPFDRPYAGFLEIEHHTALYSSDIAQKNWFSLGVIGPLSGTEKLQGVIHDLIGANKPEGWEYQVENKATFQLGYEIDYLLLRGSAPIDTQWEVSTFSHTTLGNFRSDINVGLTVRWGIDLEHSFGRLSSHFGHSGNTLNQINGYSFSFYNRLKAGYRLNDLSIDGKLPYNSHVEFNKLRTTAELGAIYYYPGGSITWSFNFYNKEYLSDIKQWHGYGKLQFSWVM